MPGIVAWPFAILVARGNRASDLKKGQFRSHADDTGTLKRRLAIANKSAYKMELKYLEPLNKIEMKLLLVTSPPQNRYQTFNFTNVHEAHCKDNNHLIVKSRSVLLDKMILSKVFSGNSQ